MKKKNERNAGRHKMFTCNAKRTQKLIPLPIYDQVIEFINKASKPYLTKQ